MENIENGNLAIGKAEEPLEKASQPLKQERSQYQNQQYLAFAENEKPDSQSSSNYKVHLSQPARALTQLQKLIWLQNKRTRGLWVQCDECDRWRYLPDILDRYELPRKWFCWMNPDKSAANCSVSESPIHLHDEEDLIHSEYSAGSLVMASLPGWPWWPAMVDDCPDTEQFYWLDGFSDIPTHYNVVFFDLHEVTRAWVDPIHLKPYSKSKNILKMSLKKKQYGKRLETAMVQADDAETLPLMDRLKKYSFIYRYKGSIVKPKTITKKYKQKYQKRFKRKYNIDLPDDSSDSESSDSDCFNNNMSITSQKCNSGGKKRKANEINYAINEHEKIIQKDSSLVVQVDTESALDLVSSTNGSSQTNVRNKNVNMSETPDTQDIENGTQSPASNDFDF